MKTRKFLTNICLSALLCSGCSAMKLNTTASTGSQDSTANSSISAVILFTNDTNGRIVDDLNEPSFGDARIAKEKEDLINEGYDTLLFSAGDEIQGAPIVNMDHGTSAINFMNATGYDLMTLGNHEFDWGYDRLQQLKEIAQFPMLAANIIRESDGEAAFSANKIFTMTDGRKIGVFGLTTPETMEIANPKDITGLKFEQANTLYERAQAQIDELKSEGCNTIICLGHLGIDDTSAPNRSIDIIDKTRGIDAFIDGHSQNEVNEMVNDTLLVQSGYNGHTLGKLTIFKDGSCGAELIPAVNLDTDVAQKISEYQTQVDKQLSAKFATTTVFLDGSDENVRTRETNLGDFVTDAMRYSAAKASGTEVDGAIQNGGGIRASLNVGSVTQKDIKTVLPFENKIVIVKVTGSELLEALEAATYCTPKLLGAFPQVSGIEYTIDTTEPYEDSEQYPNSTYFKPANPGTRVTIAKVNGKEFNLDATYSIATNDFIAAGGDTYYSFKFAYQSSEYSTGVALEESIYDYVANKLNGTIGEAYAKPQGRITVKN